MRSKRPRLFAGVRGSDFALAVTPNADVMTSFRPFSLGRIFSISEARAAVPTALLTTLVTGQNTTVLFSGLVDGVQTVGTLSFCATGNRFFLTNNHLIIKDNLDKGLLSGIETQDVKGEEAALILFQKGGFDAILSDDKRFIRRLRALDIPYLTPAVCIVILLKQGQINLQIALEKLELLSHFISSDEYHTVKWALDTWRSP